MSDGTVVSHPNVGDVVFEWNRAHTVNVYSAYQVPNAGTPEHPAAWCRGAAIDCFSVGDFALDCATVDEVRDGIQDWLAGKAGGE